MHDDDGRCVHVEERQRKPLSSVTWIFPPPMEIPVTLMDLCSFFTVILVVLG